RLPDVAGRLERKHPRASMPQGSRSRAPKQFVESCSRVRHLEPSHAAAVSAKDDRLVLRTCQVQPNDDILSAGTTSIVGHAGPSYVSGRREKGKCDWGGDVVSVLRIPSYLTTAQSLSSPPWISGRTRTGSSSISAAGASQRTTPPSSPSTGASARSV